MNWKAVIEELRRRAILQEDIVLDPYKQQSVKQSAAIVGAVLGALANAFEKGISSP